MIKPHTSYDMEMMLSNTKLTDEFYSKICRCLDNRICAEDIMADIERLLMLRLDI